MVEVDCRGYSCPIPVVKVQKAITEHPNEELLVLAETGVTRENVVRLGQSKGYDIKVEPAGDEFRIYLTPHKKGW